MHAEDNSSTAGKSSRQFDFVVVANRLPVDRVVDDDGGAHWLSSSGVVVVAANGDIKNIQEDHMALSIGGAAATLWREADGMRAIVAALSEHGDTGAGVGSYAQARIISKGA